MAINTTQISANGKWIGISATNTTLTTAILDVINEAEAQGITQNQAMMNVAGGGSTVAWSVVIIAKRH